MRCKRRFMHGKRLRRSPVKKVFTEQQLKILKKDPRSKIKIRKDTVDYPKTDIRKRGGSHAHGFTKTIADVIKSFT